MVGSLLDTHTFLWVAEGSDRLSRTAHPTLGLRSTVPCVSVVSLWEIAMKVAQGSLGFDDPLEEVIEREFIANSYARLKGVG